MSIFLAASQNISVKRGKSSSPNTRVFSAKKQNRNLSETTIDDKTYLKILTLEVAKGTIIDVSGQKKSYKFLATKEHSPTNTVKPPPNLGEGNSLHKQRFVWVVFFGGMTDPLSWAPPASMDHLPEGCFRWSDGSPVLSLICPSYEFDTADGNQKSGEKTIWDLYLLYGCFQK